MLSVIGDKTTPVGTHQRPNGVFVVGLVGEQTKYVGCFSNDVSAFNAYKFAKESHLNMLAERYKDQVEVKVYKSLYEFKIEITD